MSQTTFGIGDLAREFGVTPRTIRFYEDQGMLAPSRDGQRRDFCPRERTRRMLILRGRRLGFPLAEIREIVDLYDAPAGEESPAREAAEPKPVAAAPSAGGGTKCWAPTRGYFVVGSGGSGAPAAKAAPARKAAAKEKKPEAAAGAEKPAAAVGR